VYTIDTTTTVTVTHDAMGIMVNFLGNVYGELQLNEKTICMQVAKGYLSNIISSAAL
jgi:hypothetical protein